jgi:hypothetical protein
VTTGVFSFMSGTVHPYARTSPTQPTRYPPSNGDATTSTQSPPPEVARTARWAANLELPPARRSSRSAAGTAATIRRRWSSSRPPSRPGEIKYYVSGGGMGGGDTSSGEIQEWVAANFTATTIGGTTVYVLS